MRILIDTSAVIATLLNEELNRSIINATKSLEVVSASSLPWEVGNALVANIRKKRITENDAFLAHDYFNLMKIRLIDVDLKESIQLASKLNIYAYDAYMLSCAEKLKIPILTLDHLMIRNAEDLGIKILEVN